MDIVKITQKLEEVHRYIIDNVKLSELINQISYLTTKRLGCCKYSPTPLVGSRAFNELTQLINEGGEIHKDITQKHEKATQEIETLKNQLNEETKKLRDELAAKAQEYAQNIENERNKCKRDTAKEIEDKTNQINQLTEENLNLNDQIKNLNQRLARILSTTCDKAETEEKLKNLNYRLNEKTKEVDGLNKLLNDKNIEITRINQDKKILETDRDAQKKFKNDIYSDIKNSFANEMSQEDKEAFNNPDNDNAIIGVIRKTFNAYSTKIARFLTAHQNAQKCLNEIKPQYAKLYAAYSDSINIVGKFFSFAFTCMDVFTDFMDGTTPMNIYNKPKHEYFNAIFKFFKGLNSVMVATFQDYNGLTILRHYANLHPNNQYFQVFKTLSRISDFSAITGDHTLQKELLNKLAILINVNQTYVFGKNANKKPVELFELVLKRFKNKDGIPQDYDASLSKQNYETIQAPKKYEDINATYQTPKAPTELTQCKN